MIIAKEELHKIINTLIVREKLLIKARRICKQEAIDYNDFLSSERFFKLAEKDITSYIEIKAM